MVARRLDGNAQQLVDGRRFQHVGTHHNGIVEILRVETPQHLPHPFGIISGCYPLFILLSAENMLQHEIHHQRLERVPELGSQHNGFAEPQIFEIFLDGLVEFKLRGQYDDELLIVIYHFIKLYQTPLQHEKWLALG